jgi:tetratricopeptide (TPR) repeat protein
MSAPVVFISYSHDSKEHIDRVLALSDKLRSEGVDCILDQYETSPPEGWSRWMDKHIRDSDFVVMICTETYYRRVIGEEKPGTGRGVKWEGNLIYQHIYNADTMNTRFIPVLFEQSDSKYIPIPCQGGTYYCIYQDYEELYRHLTNQPWAIKPNLGKLQELAPRQRIQDFFADLKVSLAKMPSTSPDLFGREHELDILDKAWDDTKTNIVTLVAFGGVGKTALVNKWLNKMKEDNYRGAERVLAWSFYSQGAAEGKQASAEPFIAHALKEWFGDPETADSNMSPWDKGERLANFVKQYKTLLILDGLESLQYPPGEMEGRLRDPGLQCLIRELASHNSGLCVVNTRLKVDDIKGDVGDSVEEIELENLSPEAGAQILEKLGVEGLPDELKEAVEDMDGHALALILLGTYLKIVYHGDIRKRDEIKRLIGERRQDENTRHARDMMNTYEKWFKGKPELEILYIMGLFDKPAEGGAIEAVKKKPTINGLTSELRKLSYEDWMFAVDNLRRARLLAEEDPHRPGELDCHPLVREYFGIRLKESNTVAWKKGHSRLYEWYESQAKKYPDTIEEMIPLYTALSHCCQAGRWREADRLYTQRISRENEAFHLRKLGAFGADLSALSGFFDVPWSKPVDELSEHDKAFVLSQAGFDLRALGRLSESAQPTQASLESAKDRKDWLNSAKVACNLSELYLTIGDTAKALNYVEQSVKLADQSGDAFERMCDRTTLADVQHQIGRQKDAEDTFKAAEDLQKKRQPKHPILYTVAGFEYCDLLLEQGKYEEVLDRANKTLEIAKQKDLGLLNIAIDHLSLGRAYKLKDQIEKGDFSKATEHLDQAVNGLRQAGIQDYLSHGLLARASLRRICKDFDMAKHDVDEAFSIASRGDMGLWLADCHLEYARLYYDKGEKDKARDSLKIAKEMIDRMGYHRRDKEVQELEGKLK